MTTAPEPMDELHIEDMNEKPPKLQLMPTLSGTEFLRAVNYPVIVEMWEKKKAGRVKRAYLKEFTEDERKTLSSWHTKFHRWHLVTGTPNRVMLKLSTLAFLQRAVNFFGSI